MDFARSDDPRVQRQLERLSRLAPSANTLGLEGIQALLAKLGHPERRLPPVFHVAGTNGKGSTCAFLRAVIEAAGLRVHVYTSPHLVRFNERIRIDGRLIADGLLAGLLEEALDARDGQAMSFFEVSTAAALLAFARTPADACILEVGLGGRLDATNVVAEPAACGIAALGIDHQAFLGSMIGQIAGEKAGIARRGVPIATLAYEPEAETAIEAMVTQRGAVRRRLGVDWFVDTDGYRDHWGVVQLPALPLGGAHQRRNAALALAMIRHQQQLRVPEPALAAGLARADWPARMQLLRPGPLTGGRETWLDGGHNPSAAAALATAFAGRSLHLVLGMLANKDAEAFLTLLRPVAASLTAVPIDGHEHHRPEALCALAQRLDLPARAAASVAEALGPLAGPVLITGSLYLAGAVLAANGQPPQ